MPSTPFYSPHSMLFNPHLLTLIKTGYWNRAGGTCAGTLHNVDCTPHSMHTALYALHTAACTLHNAHCALCTSHCAFYTLYTMHYAHYLAYFARYAPHFAHSRHPGRSVWAKSATIRFWFSNSRNLLNIVIFSLFGPIFNANMDLFRGNLGPCEDKALPNTVVTIPGLILSLKPANPSSLTMDVVKEIPGAQSN